MNEDAQFGGSSLPSDGFVTVKTESDEDAMALTQDHHTDDFPHIVLDVENEIPTVEYHAENDEEIQGMMEDFLANSAIPAPEDSIQQDSEYTAALDAVERKREEIARKDSIDGSTATDHVELKRLEVELTKVRKRRGREEAYQAQVDDQTMFIPIEDDIEMTPTPSRGQAMNNEAIDISDDDDEEDQESARLRRPAARGGRAPKGRQKGRKVTNKVDKGGVQKSGQSAKRGARGGRPAPSMLNIGSLYSNNIVADAAANQGAGEQPNFGGRTNRRDALTALLASVPLDQRDTKRGEKAAFEKAAKQFRCRGQGSMQVKNDGWRLKGMPTNLKNFQLLGAAWGCEREAGSEAPFGGILADTMGYGKTVQMITIMVENRPKPQAKNKTTLIVVPNSIVRQWVDEIAIHTDEGVMDHIVVHKSGNRVEGSDLVRKLRQYQVVITTYHEVMSNYPKCNPPIHLVTDKAKDEWWEQYYNENKGPLLSIPFHRVILDEAHFIKNHESRSSKACRLLTAKYKWIITGTPLSNCMEELFPYFHFLGVTGAGSYAQFTSNYTKRNDTTTSRLDAILRTVMIRRTGADRLLGKPLVSLPALDHQTLEVAFSDIERSIYTVVRQRFITKINDWSISGKIKQISSNIFVLLLRLRQMCAHVFMVTAVVRDLLESEDIEKLWSAVRRHQQEGNSTGSKTAKVLASILEKARDEREDSATSTSELPSFSARNSTIDLIVDDAGMDLRGLFYHWQRSGHWAHIKRRSRCHLCKEPPEGAEKLSKPCGHLYCEECLQVLLNSAKSAKKTATCSECEADITGSADMESMERIEREAGAYQMESPAIVQKKGRRKKNKEPDTTWLNVPGAELMSTKVQAIVSMLEEWINADPQAKIVIFTLFLPMVKVFAKICVRKGWGYQEYTGAISQNVRNQSLEAWKDPTEDNKILLMSTRAGGVGLNLVEARYAVIVDPWWNEPVEDQAFSRIYRIGQKQDCVVRKVLIKDAIDTQLMLHLQKVKAEECDRVIDGRSQKELTIPDLMRLFGPTRRDPETNEIIIDGDEDNMNDGMDEFVTGDDHIVIDDSDTEEVSATPSRPQD